MDDAIQIQLKCSKCGRVVATVPEGYHLEEALICPGCGAAVKPPGVIGKIAGELKDSLAEVAGRRERESEQGRGNDRDQGRTPSRPNGEPPP